MPNSPADVAGLLPYSDYVIGSPEGLMRGENGLGEIIEDVSVMHVLYTLKRLTERSKVHESPTAPLCLQQRI